MYGYFFVRKQCLTEKSAFSKFRHEKSERSSELIEF
jgi:hypothetical protein